MPVVASHTTLDLDRLSDEDTRATTVRAHGGTATEIGSQGLELNLGAIAQDGPAGENPKENDTSLSGGAILGGHLRGGGSCP